MFFVLIFFFCVVHLLKPVVLLGFVLVKLPSDKRLRISVGQTWFKKEKIKIRG